MNNVVNWFEIATTDLERAKNFYAEVFKKEFDYMDMDETKMYMFKGGPDSPGATGAIFHSANVKPGADGSTVYFSCDDVSVEASRIEKAGGKLLFPKTSIGEHGFICQAMDTEGNRIGLHSNQ